jgi:hypothetical protein
MVGEDATMENDFASAMDMIESVNETVKAYIRTMTEVKAEELGLDSRCGHLRVSTDSIAVPKNRDNTLQYYGGFEYVDKDHRTEVGDWVFYFDEDNRVSEHLYTYVGNEVAKLYEHE